MFERVDLPQRGMLGRSLIYLLHARANSDLLIAHLINGLSVLHVDGNLVDIPDRAGRPIGAGGAIDAAPDGTIWVVTPTGVHAFAQGAWRTVVDGAGWEPGAAEAVQAITVAPTVLQSTWFKALCVLLLILLGVGLYRYRIRVLTARLVERMQVRTSERERIARTLHDTYLQSVHALMLRVGATAQALPGADPIRATLETALADASSVVAEGRGQVAQLRAGPGTPADPVEVLLARSAETLRQRDPATAVAIAVEGEPRALRPQVLEEAAQIGMEALRNAFLHACAARIDIVVDYGTPFTLTVRDDGKGLDDTAREQGYRSGHWGLLGMRERARGIGAQVHIDSAAGSGTSIRLVVPHAFAGARPRWHRTLLARWRRQ